MCFHGGGNAFSSRAVWFQDSLELVPQPCALWLASREVQSSQQNELSTLLASSRTSCSKSRSAELSSWLMFWCQIFSFFKVTVQFAESTSVALQVARPSRCGKTGEGLRAGGAPRHPAVSSLLSLVPARATSKLLQLQSIFKKGLQGQVVLETSPHKQSSSSNMAYGLGVRMTGQ